MELNQNQIKNQVLSADQGSDVDLQELFDSVLKPDSNAPSQLPWSERDLPNSFFNPPPVGSKSSNHSRENSFDSGFGGLTPFEHQRAHSSPATLQQTPPQHRTYRLSKEEMQSNIPLPLGWEQSTTPEGHVFYLDHIARITTWEDPRKKLQLDHNANQFNYQALPHLDEATVAAELAKASDGWDELRRLRDVEQQHNANQPVNKYFNNLTDLATFQGGWGDPTALQQHRPSYANQPSPYSNNLKVDTNFPTFQSKWENSMKLPTHQQPHQPSRTNESWPNFNSVKTGADFQGRWEDSWKFPAWEIQGNSNLFSTFNQPSSNSNTTNATTPLPYPSVQKQPVNQPSSSFQTDKLGTDSTNTYCCSRKPFGHQHQQPTSSPNPSTFNLNTSKPCKDLAPNVYCCWNEPRVLKTPQPNQSSNSNTTKVCTHCPPCGRKRTAQHSYPPLSAGKVGTSDLASFPGKWRDPRKILKAQQQRQVAILRSNPNNSASFPAGWSQTQTATGQTYFINHQTETTSWLDPRIPDNLQRIEQVDTAQDDPTSQKDDEQARLQQEREEELKKLEEIGRLKEIEKMREIVDPILSSLAGQEPEESGLTVSGQVPGDLTDMDDYLGVGACVAKPDVSELVPTLGPENSRILDDIESLINSSTI